MIPEFPKTDDPWLQEQVACWLDIADQDDVPEFYQAMALGIQIRLVNQTLKEEAALGRKIMEHARRGEEYVSPEKSWVRNHFACRENRFISRALVVIFRLTDQLNDLPKTLDPASTRRFRRIREERDALEGALLVFGWAGFSSERIRKALKRLDRTGEAAAASLGKVPATEQLWRAQGLFLDWWWVQNLDTSPCQNGT